MDNLEEIDTFLETYNLSRLKSESNNKKSEKTNFQ